MNFREWTSGRALLEAVQAEIQSFEVDFDNPFVDEIKLPPPMPGSENGDWYYRTFFQKLKNEPTKPEDYPLRGPIGYEEVCRLSYPNTPSLSLSLSLCFK